MCPAETVYAAQDFEVPETGLFTWDIPDNILYADHALAELFGLDALQAEQGLPVETYLSRVHPIDRPRLAKTIRDCIVLHRPQQDSYRVCGLDGYYKDVVCFARVFRNRSGDPVRYAGIVVPAAVARDRAPSIF
ncbi:PAS domain-containing protein [Rhizobium sp. SSA_523]|uniref:PAS domain-containing protein n=1 Tax=Rhizobium sp. SSA_523 TaxID=2952477 RepID=UPI00209152D4|nr:PAS domain-containing protein [Rhizobium sp. SSA_523]MCO5731161.1 PAS domain-containing protein [Rhizobium sp. SSA_523]WKC22294.1 PAS domain-containing protein [Rhizobium sp. SSA_523]